MKKLFGFYIHKEKGLFWFRIFDCGLFFKNTKMYSTTFSEYHKYVKYLMIGSWLIRPLFPTEEYKQIVKEKLYQFQCFYFGRKL